MSSNDAIAVALESIGEEWPAKAERRRLKGSGAPIETCDDSSVAVDMIVAWRRIDDLDRRIARLRMSSDHGARVRARSIASWEHASQHPEVIEFRSTELGSVQVAGSNVADWLSRKGSKRDRNARTWGWLDYPTDDGGVRQMRVAKNGMLFRLREAANRLAGFYRWEPAWGTAFLLSGAIPVVEQITTSTRRTRSGNRLVLECDPSTTPESLVAAFEEERRRFGTRRTPKEESFRMYGDWVGTGRPHWEDFAERWNDEHGTEYKPENCRERIGRVRTFLDA